MQGDSITDANRDRERSEHMGRGYALFTAAALELAHPGEFEYLNRGISGNRIVDVYARIKADIINLKPDYMSLLIGVNDVWHEYSRQNGVEPAKFERIYEMLLDEVEEALPEIKIILMGAFFLPGLPYDYESFRADVEERAAITKKIAERRGYPFIDLQALFDEATARGVNRLTTDGVHPDFAGCELIKNALVATFEEVIK
jgi:lysophospholipase L1-like esterase